MFGMYKYSNLSIMSIAPQNAKDDAIVTTDNEASAAESPAPPYSKPVNNVLGPFVWVSLGRGVSARMHEFSDKPAVPNSQSTMIEFRIGAFGGRDFSINVGTTFRTLDPIRDTWINITPQVQIMRISRNVLRARVRDLPKS